MVLRGYLITGGLQREEQEVSGVGKGLREPTFAGVKSPQ